MHHYVLFVVIKFIQDEMLLCFLIVGLVVLFFVDGICEDLFVFSRDLLLIQLLNCDGHLTLLSVVLHVLF